MGGDGKGDAELYGATSCRSTITRGIGARPPWSQRKRNREVGDPPQRPTGKYWSGRTGASYDVDGEGGQAFVKAGGLNPRTT